MITNYHSHIFVLAIGFIFLLLLPNIICANDQVEETSIEKQIRTPTSVKNHLYDIFKQENLNSNSNEEETKDFIEDLFKNHPYRRASSFHAMRGKRSIKIA